VSVFNAFKYPSLNFFIFYLVKEFLGVKATLCGRA